MALFLWGQKSTRLIRTNALSALAISMSPSVSRCARWPASRSTPGSSKISRRCGKNTANFRLWRVNYPGLESWLALSDSAPATLARVSGCFLAALNFFGRLFFTWLRGCQRLKVFGLLFRLFLDLPVRLCWWFVFGRCRASRAFARSAFFLLQARLFQLGRQLRIALDCLLSLFFLCAGSGVGRVDHRPPRAGLLAVAVATFVSGLRPSSG